MMTVNDGEEERFFRDEQVSKTRLGICARPGFLFRVLAEQRETKRDETGGKRERKRE